MAGHFEAFERLSSIMHRDSNSSRNQSPRGGALYNKDSLHSKKNERHSSVSKKQRRPSLTKGNKFSLKRHTNHLIQNQRENPFNDVPSTTHLPEKVGDTLPAKRNYPNLAITNTEHHSSMINLASPNVNSRRSLWTRGAPPTAAQDNISARNNASDHSGALSNRANLQIRIKVDKQKMSISPSPIGNGDVGGPAS